MDEQSRVQTIVLRDGARERVRVRPIRPDDVLRLQAFVTRCSPRTIFLRANVVRPARLTDAEAAYLTHVDYRSTMALVALTGAEPNAQIVAVARYACSEAVPGQAEAAIIVEDAYQRRGLGRQLLARLVSYARDQGISSLVGNVLSENGPVLGLIRGAGLAAEYFDAGHGEYQVVVPLARGASSYNLPARAAARVGRSLRWHRNLASQLVILLRGA